MPTPSAVPPLPDDYRRDREQIDRKILRSTDPKNHRYGAVTAARTVNAAVLAFLNRWQGRPEVAADGDYLAKQREMLDQTTGHLEAMHHAILAQLLAHRKLCLANEELAVSGHEVMEAIRGAPAEQRAEVEEVLHQQFGPHLDMEQELKRIRAKIKKDAASFRQLLEDYETEWPDRMGDPLFQRILAMTTAEYATLAAELETRRKKSKGRS